MRVIAGARGHLATRTRVLNRNTTGGPTLGEGPDYNTGASQQAMSAEAPPLRYRAWCMLRPEFAPLKYYNTQSRQGLNMAS